MQSSVEVMLFPQTVTGDEFIVVLLAAEDILADLGVRQAMRKMPKHSRL
jgi:hypothetical protein